MFVLLLYFYFFYLEPRTRIELVTPSLPRKCSAPELPRQTQSGKPGSNRPPTAWKAVALPYELLPQYKFQVKSLKLKVGLIYFLLLTLVFSLFPCSGGGRRIRTSEG